ncbi:uncharacterized protein HD556DRAFT_1441819 [Suillus plorans]|uniref:Protein-S-isoprenylcysteine O-methyltransferase n=1 Tax=Suillus plorans TaxID=116603 RepID=A0A9P7AT02_9AGAM|nr:uncharacterized protein HD556DRAFT_1441819 [Suillus plorans]KAG1795986.1 hypothetical protein HD556DRAFT_1441819 [Suillus plorans]
MSLLKIPFILASAIGTHVSFTSPSPSPSSKESVVPSLFEFIIKWCIKLRCPELMKINIWAISLVEVANILATRIGPSDIPEGISGTRAVQLLHALHPTPITPAFLVGSIAIALGGALRFYCMSTLGKFWSFNLSVRKEHRLMTSGPYSVVRHPSYAGLLLQSAGTVVAYGSQGSWMRQSGILQVPFIKALTSITFVLVIIHTWISLSRPAPEDQMLQGALGEEWETWAKEVRYRLVPGIY